MMIKLVCIISLTIILVLYQYFKKRKRTANLSVPDLIKFTYNKITISSDKLKILTREYYEDEEKDEFPGTVEMLDSLVNNPPPGKVLKHVSVLSYDDFSLHGKKKIFNSYPVYISEPVLKHKLKKQEFVDIYYKEEDEIKSYFDLSFLR